jgi:predicted ATPase
VRLVTITGPGGSGKARLVVQIVNKVTVNWQ